MDRRRLILCPLEHEARIIRCALGRRPDITIEISGAGPRSVERALERALDRDRFGDVVLVGVAGALREVEQAALCAHAIVDRDGRRFAPPLTTGPNATIVGVDAPVPTPAEKASLRAATGADLVDCESHAFAAWCERRGVQWGVVRGVSDGPNESLPPDVSSWTDERGRTRMGRVAFALLRRPGLLPTLIRLARRSKRSLREAARLASDLLASSGGSSIASPMTERATIPVPDDVRTLLLYGGSFDPPHRAHLELPEAALDWVGADWLLYMPSAHSPLKQEGPVAGEQDRLAMIRRAIKGMECASVSDLEIERGGTSYTVDTLRELRRRLSDAATIRFLIGADQALSFHRWREARAIIEIAEPVVLLRTPPGDVDALLEEMAPHWSESELERWRSWIAPCPRVDISSTEVRETLRRSGPDSPSLEGVVPDAVLDFIRQRGLYFEAGAARRDAAASRES